jgi:hypothetical protein
MDEWKDQMSGSMYEFCTITMDEILCQIESMYEFALLQWMKCQIESMYEFALLQWMKCQIESVYEFALLQWMKCQMNQCMHLHYHNG